MFGVLIFGPLTLIAVAKKEIKRCGVTFPLWLSQWVDLSEPKAAGDVAHDIIKKRRGYLGHNRPVFHG